MWLECLCAADKSLCKYYNNTAILASPGRNTQTTTIMSNSSEIVLNHMQNIRGNVEEFFLNGDGTNRITKPLFKDMFYHVHERLTYQKIIYLMLMGKKNLLRNLICLFYL